MTKYEVFFEIYGKKMKTTVEAQSEEVAKHLVKEKIQFHKIVKSSRSSSKTPKKDQHMKNIRDVFNKAGFGNMFR